MIAVLVFLGVLLAPGDAAAEVPAPAPALTPESRSLVVVNARVFGHPGKTAVAVRDGLIDRVGDEATARAAAGPRAPAIDAGGGWVLPGLQDCHLHLLSSSLGLDRPDLSSCNSVADVQKVLSARSGQGATGPVVGQGWRYSIATEARPLSRTDLDAVSRDRPVVLESYDGHASWVNTKALRDAGIDSGSRDPEDGTIVREADGKTPSGLLLEGAAALVNARLPEPSAQEKARALERGIAMCLQVGLTAVDTVERDEGAIGLLSELQRRGRLPIRVAVSLPLEGDLDRYDALRSRLQTPFLGLGPLKAFIDGVIESRTALMIRPYPGTDVRGKPMVERRRLFELVAAAHARRFPVMVHAIGDGAVRMALDAFESAASRHPKIRLGHRIEHIEVVDPSDVPRFAKLGVVASMQPYHALPSADATSSDPWTTNLRDDQLPMTFAWRALARAGATLAFGSDWSVVTIDPLPGIAVAATRTREDGLPAGGSQPHQKLTVEEAIDAYTRGASIAVGRERELGRIDPGMRADLVVLSPEVRLDRPASFFEGRVRHTIVDGVVRYSAGSGKPRPR
ncbi:MAG: amidohydrolase [Candidatus Riflebacteria bacterium]|nr:amidohydrolase [Candidatus Riflebacteria bacterium]